MSHHGVDPSLHRTGYPTWLEKSLNTDFEPGTLEKHIEVGVMKEADTLDAHIYQGMPFGRNETVASRPTLEFPIWNIRTAGPIIEKFVLETNKQYDELVDSLPDDLKQTFLAELGKPAHLRNPDFIALDQAIATTANLMAYLSIAAAPVDPTSKAQLLAEVYSQMPNVSYQNAIQLGEQIVLSARNYLQEIGPNDPEFDQLNHTIGRLGQALSRLNEYSTLDNAAKFSDKAREAFSKWGAQLQLLNKQYHHKETGGQMQILGPMLNALELMSAVKSLEGGEKGLLIGLSLANLSASLKDSELGLVGQNLYKLGNLIGTALQKAVLPDANIGHEKLIPLLATAFVIGTVLLGSNSFGAQETAVNEDLTDVAKRHADMQSQVNLMFATLMTKIIYEQDLIGTLLADDIGSLPYGFDADLSPKQLMADTLEFLSGYLGLSALNTNNTLASGFLFENIAPYLSKDLSTIEGFVSALITQETLPEGVERDTLQNVAATITEAKIALESEDLSAFLTATKGVAEAIGINSDSLLTEINDLSKLAKTIGDMLSEKNLEDQANAFTGMSQV